LEVRKGEMRFDAKRRGKRKEKKKKAEEGGGNLRPAERKGPRRRGIIFHSTEKGGEKEGTNLSYPFPGGGGRAKPPPVQRESKTPG